MLTKYRIEYTECDFKREVERTKTKNWLKTICAYANGIGGMYDGIPVQFQDIENVVSTRRNPVVADLLSRMNFMERRGSGFRKIINAVKTAPNFKDETLPAFRSTPFFFTIEIKNMNDGINGEIINDTLNDTIKLSYTEVIILNQIQNDCNITREILTSKLGFSDSTIARGLKMLQKKGYITRVGAKKKGYWQVNEIKK
ncbi:MAG: ATP-binding protein [Bacteroidales bacterium]|nr:ATP-binding protein [Bacteroidales bacterium]